MVQVHGTNLRKMNENGIGKGDPLLLVVLSMGRWMKNGGQIMQEANGQRILQK
jgi:hypothetical protein